MGMGKWEAQRNLQCYFVNEKIHSLPQHFEVGNLKEEEAAEAKQRRRKWKATTAMDSPLLRAHQSSLPPCLSPSAFWWFWVIMQRRQFCIFCYCWVEHQNPMDGWQSDPVRSARCNRKLRPWHPSHQTEKHLMTLCGMNGVSLCVLIVDKKYIFWMIHLLVCVCAKKNKRKIGWHYWLANFLCVSQFIIKTGVKIICTPNKNTHTTKHAWRRRRNRGGTGKQQQHQQQQQRVGCVLVVRLDCSATMWAGWTWLMDVQEGGRRNWCWFGIMRICRCWIKPSFDWMDCLWMKGGGGATQRWHTHNGRYQNHSKAHQLAGDRPDLFAP